MLTIIKKITRTNTKLSNLESLSFEDEGVIRVKAFMAIAKDEPAMRKTDASKFNSLKQELFLCKSELIVLKNTKAHNLSLQNEITRLNLDNESLTDEVYDLKKVEEESSVKAIKKKAQTKSPSIPEPCPDKKADSFTEKLLLTLMQETLSKLKAQSSHTTSSRKALKIPKPFIPCKYCGFNDHHSDECEYYLDVTSVVALLMNPLTVIKRPLSTTRNQGLLLMSTWMAFGGNTQRGDGVTGIKRRCRDLSDDGVEDLTMASGRNRLKSNLEDSTW
ncbi:hypothetical protein Tco_1288843 [Tanacetum coccineum]